MRAVWVLLLTSCTSWKLDDTAPFVELRGSPPSTSGRQRVTRRKTDSPTFVLGADGVEWLALNFPQNDSGPEIAPKLVRLGEPSAEIELSDPFYVSHLASRRAVFQFGTTFEVARLARVTVTRPGAASASFDFDGNFDGFAYSDDVAAFYMGPLLIPQGTQSGTGFIQRTDGSFRRMFNVDGHPESIFDLHGERLFTFDGDGMIRARSARDETDVAIGGWAAPVFQGQMSPPVVLLRSDPPQLIVCDQLGLRTLQLVPSSWLVLDPDECNLSEIEVRRDRLVYYATHLGQTVLRSVPVDGSAPPVRLAHDDRTVLVFDADRIAWTTRADPFDGVFSPRDVGDGWVDDTQFMERGRVATFSADGRHLYYLEHAATGGSVGELRSYEIATGTTHVLALNAGRFAELPDGRLLAVTNAWQVNDWDRVVVIDEARRTADWVAEGADAFTIVPGSSEVLVELVTNSDDVTMARMPIPPVAP